MNFGRWHRRIVAGGGGALGPPARALLAPLAWLYGGMLTLRNRHYDRRRERLSRLPVPVVSVGNITVGGTGKTPLVIELARMLRDRGLKPAVVMRGYKSDAAGLSDEAELIRRRAPDSACVCDADRVAGARRAIDAHAADVIVLDDGFQHRRLARDLDIVLIDATCPFGYGHVLPRGLLREPIGGLARADLVVVTRADEVDRARLGELTAEIGRYAPGVPVLRCRHAADSIVDLHGRPLSQPPPGAALCFAGVGNPESFRRTIESMGVKVAGAAWYPDHHHYQPSDARRLAQAVKDGAAAWLLTTEKDAVKLARLSVDWPIPVAALRVRIDFLDGGDTILASTIDRAVSEKSRVRQSV